MSLIELTIAVAVAMTIMLGSAGAFGSSIKAANEARRTSRGSLFLQTAMEDMAAQRYDNLLSFNGNRIYDHGTAADSEFGIDFTVTQATVELRRIDAVLTDVRTGSELGHAATLRSKR